MSAAHDHHHDEMLYQAWVQVIEWMKEYAAEKGVQFSKESDFPDFIYRMERPYDLPTTMMAVSLSDERGEPFFFASVSPRHAKLKHVPSGCRAAMCTTMPTGKTAKAWCSRASFLLPKKSSTRWPTGPELRWPRPKEQA